MPLTAEKRKYVSEGVVTFKHGSERGRIEAGIHKDGRRRKVEAQSR